jgi:hypothetical protein
VQRRQSALRLSRCSGCALHSLPLARALMPYASAGCLRRFLLRRRLPLRLTVCLHRRWPSVTFGTSARTRLEASCSGRLWRLSMHWQLRLRMPCPFRVALTRCPWGRSSYRFRDDPRRSCCIFFGWVVLHAYSIFPSHPMPIPCPSHAHPPPPPPGGAHACSGAMIELLALCGTNALRCCLL